MVMMKRKHSPRKANNSECEHAEHAPCLSGPLKKNRRADRQRYTFAVLQYIDVYPS